MEAGVVVCRISVPDPQIFLSDLEEFVENRRRDYSSGDQ
jgi:hypothetical protein